MLSVVLSSCNKTKNEIEYTTDSKKSNSKNTMLVIPSTELPASAFITNSEDPLDEKVNFAIYHLTKAYLPILSNSTLRNDMIDKIQNAPSKIYNLYDYADAHSEIDPMLNEYFTSLLGSTTTINNRTFLNENLRYDLVYSPYVHLANQDGFDRNLPPIFVSCTQMNPDINAEMEDYVPGWKLENGATKFIYLHPNDIKILRNPIIVFDNNIRESEVIVYKSENILYSDLEDEEIPSNQNNGTPEVLPNNVFAMSRFKVEKAYKFEKGISGKIDFCIAGSLARSSTMGDADDLKWVIKVKKSKLGTVINKYKEIFNSQHPSFPTNNGIYLKSVLITDCYTGLGTFEFDPFASQKTLANVCHSLPAGGAGTPMILFGRRNYYGDWYSFDPATNNGYDINPLHPWLNFYQTWTNYKSMFEVYNPY